MNEKVGFLGGQKVEQTALLVINNWADNKDPQNGLNIQ